MRRIWKNGYFRVVLLSGLWLIPLILLGLDHKIAGMIYILVFALGVMDNQDVWWRKTNEPDKKKLL